MPNLNPISINLSDRHLIEASAGTGKTYTITSLYLRLLLEHNVNKDLLTVEHILVVTFTNAATDELKQRIRARLVAAFQCFLGLKCNDPFICELYKKYEDKKEFVLNRLDLAIRSIDDASIFTINSFAKRMLSELAFEARCDFNQEIINDDSLYLIQAAEDFWRTHCYNLSSFLASEVIEHFKDPEKLSSLVAPFIQKGVVKILPKTLTLADSITDFENLVYDLKNNWHNYRAVTFDSLIRGKLDGRSYGTKENHYNKLNKLLDLFFLWLDGKKPLPKEDSVWKRLCNFDVTKGLEDKFPIIIKMRELEICISNFYYSFLSCACREIKILESEAKRDLRILSQDDLLIQLNNSLKNDYFGLSEKIKRRFPVALIDEFQDTNKIQSEIFFKIYKSNNVIDKQHQLELFDYELCDYGLFFIGDPKQAIYGFRGADIFSYIKAKDVIDIKKRHYLDENWRSTTSMVNAVNKLFQKKDPFLEPKIEFKKTIPRGGKDCDFKLKTADSNSKSSLELRLIDYEKVGDEDIANDCADTIASILQAATRYDATIKDEIITPNDLVVLVYTRTQAALIKRVLAKRNIHSVYLQKSSVFSSLEAKEIAVILNSLIDYKNEYKIRCALVTKFIGFNAQEIRDFSSSEAKRQSILVAWHHSNMILLTKGIYPAFMHLAKATLFIDNIAADEDYERRLTDIRHILELLQHESSHIESASSLLHWLMQQISKPSGSDSEQRRLESEKNLIRIITIHKSKGLEFPICFIPFAPNSKDNSIISFYNDGQELIADLNANTNHLVKRQDLEEKIRLLYVAVTRSIYKCYISLSKKDFEQTALYSLFDLKSIDELESFLELFKDNDISYVKVCNKEQSLVLTSQGGKNKLITPKQVVNRSYHDWRLTSYSSLVKKLDHPQTEPASFDEILEPAQFVDAEHIDLNRFTFERGSNAGSFLHAILEQIDFVDPDFSILPNLMKKFGIDLKWEVTLIEWYKEVLAAPLAPLLCLNMIISNKRLIELEFHLPFSKLVDIQLNQLLVSHGYLSPNVNFEPLSGILKGFVDLIFMHNDKYYIVDYKSNYLGDDFSFYNTDAMQDAISSHKYDLQYIFYTLALHRYLKFKLSNYSYEEHFGGCYYLFLRGLNANTTAGVFFDLPDKELILELDALFSKGIC